MLRTFAHSKRFEALRAIALTEPERYLRMSADIKRQLEFYLILRRAGTEKARAA